MGESDTAILWTIITIFVILGTVLPFIHQDFAQPQTDLDSKGIEFAGGQEVKASSVTILSVIISIFTMFFWSFGNIPTVPEIIIFVPMRIIFLVVLYRNLRGN